jgi:uncharacterized protein with FMN-binding domain
MILGIATALVFVLTASVFFTSRLPASSRLRRAAHAAHKPLGYALVALSAVHLFLALKLFYQRPLALFLLGFAMTACAMFACLWKFLFKKNPKRGLLAHKISGLVMAALLVAHILVCVNSLAVYQQEMAAVTLSGVSAKHVPDGVYEGSCDVGYIQARVQVTVADGEMTTIDLLEHRNERGAAGEGVLDRMLAAQTTDVDSVSGATNSSRVIRRAVENALKAGESGQNLPSGS